MYLDVLIFGIDISHLVHVPERRWLQKARRRAGQAAGSGWWSALFEGLVSTRSKVILYSKKTCVKIPLVQLVETSKPAVFWF